MKKLGKVTLLGTILIGVTSVGITTQADNTAGVASQNVYRLYNKNTGEHFYTTSTPEKAADIKAGWTDEGIGWYAPAKSSTPVYRVYNPNEGDHYYSESKYEAGSLVKTGWKWDNNEEPVFYSGGTIPTYVAYNPNAKSGAHNYTTSQFEQNNLLKQGWRYGAIAWYGVKGPNVTQPDNQPIHIYFARHGQTLFNVLGRLQGWSDSPLTSQGILVAAQTGKGIGVGDKSNPAYPAIHFDAAYSSDVTRTENTARLLLDYAGQTNLAVTPDSDFREVCDGSFEGLTQAEGNQPVYVLGGYNWDKNGNPLEGGGYKKLDDGTLIGYQDQLFANAGKNLEPHLGWLHQADINLSGQDPKNPSLSLKGIPLAEDYQTVVNRMENGTNEVVKEAEQENEHNVLVVSSGMSLEILLTNLDSTCGPKYFNGHSLANASISEVTYSPSTKTYVVDYASDTTYSTIGTALLPSLQ